MRWSVIFGLDVLTEIMALAIPICILWPLRMKKGDKMKVITAFSLRVGLVARISSPTFIHVPSELRADLFF